MCVQPYVWLILVVVEFQQVFVLYIMVYAATHSTIHLVDRSQNDCVVNFQACVIINYDVCSTVHMVENAPQQCYWLFPTYVAVDVNQPSCTIQPCDWLLPTYVAVDVNQPSFTISRLTLNPMRVVIDVKGHVGCNCWILHS